MSFAHEIIAGCDNNIKRIIFRKHFKKRHKNFYCLLEFNEKVVSLQNLKQLNMSTKSIFAGFGIRVELIYRKLVKLEFISYADVLALYCGRPKGYHDKIACSSEPGYGELKKAFPDVLKALERVCPDTIVNNGLSKGRAYRYIGRIDDPLSEERKAVVQKSIENYAAFVYYNKRIKTIV